MKAYLKKEGICDVPFLYDMMYILGFTSLDLKSNFVFHDLSLPNWRSFLIQMLPFNYICYQRM